METTQNWYDAGIKVTIMPVLDDQDRITHYTWTCYAENGSNMGPSIGRNAPAVLPYLDKAFAKAEQVSPSHGTAKTAELCKGEANAFISIVEQKYKVIAVVESERAKHSYKALLNLKQ